MFGKLMLQLWCSHFFKKYLNYKYLIFIYLFRVKLLCKTRQICVFTSHHHMLPFIFSVLKICHLMFLFYIYNFNELHSTFELVFFWSKKIHPNSCDRVQDNYCPETKCSNYTLSLWWIDKWGLSQRHHTNHFPNNLCRQTRLRQSQI